MPSSWRRHIRLEDFLWLLLFSALVVFSPQRHPDDFVLLIALGIVHVLEPHIGAKISIPIKLILCLLLLSRGEAVDSSIYLILLLAVISAAMRFGILGTALTTLAACAIFLSFLLSIDFVKQEIDPDGVRELVLRGLFILMVGLLAYEIADAKRQEAQKLQETAAQLAESNRHLQEAQAQILRSERLAALGQLTAGLAHELRNPLGTMKTSAELLRRQVGNENEIAKEMAEYISSEVDRTNSLVTRFLDFARPQHLHLEKMDLATLLDRTIERFERERTGAAASVTVYKNYSPEIPPVPLDGELMERVFSNLLSNAAQASPASGSITVKTRLEETGDSVEIAVIDRGSGIDAKNLENIFNPFFTTKSEGTGLGLAIVSKIVDEHGGQVTVESSPGEGSVFRVRLPLK